MGVEDGKDGRISRRTLTVRVGAGTCHLGVL